MRTRSLGLTLFSGLAIFVAACSGGTSSPSAAARHPRRRRPRRRRRRVAPEPAAAPSVCSVAGRLDAAAQGRCRHRRRAARGQVVQPVLERGRDGRRRGDRWRARRHRHPEHLRLRRKHPDVRRPGLRRHRDRRLPDRHRHGVAAAKANPDVKFVGVDQGICVDEQGVPDPTFTCAGDAAALLPNYQGIVFAEAQPGYLAGIVAASITESNTIGAVGGTNVPAVVNYWRGYENGAKSVNPDVEVLYQETDPDPAKGFNDPTKGRAIAEQFIGQGADVIFQIAGLTGQGALEAVCEADIHGIGVDVDQAVSLPNLAPCIVTSAEKKLVDTVTAVVTSVATDTFVAGTVAYNAASDPVSDRPRAVPRQRGADHARDPVGDRRRARGLRRRVARPVRARQVHGRRQLARPAQPTRHCRGAVSGPPLADSRHAMMRATLDPGSPSPAA